MRFTWLLLSFIIILFLSGCSVGVKTTVTKHYPSLDSLQEFRVLDIGQSMPKNAIIIGTIMIYDKTLCDSAQVFNAAKREVLKAGGNVFKTTVHLYPDAAQSCHELTGMILKVDNFNDSSFFSKPFERSEPQKKETGSRFVLNAGYSIRTLSKPENMDSFEKTYYGGLKSGRHYELQYDFFFDEETAFTLQCNLFKSSNSTYISADSGIGIFRSGSLNDNVNILYLAPGLTWRMFSPTKMNAFLFGATIGYIHYKEEADFINYVTVKGGSLGLSLGLGYDFGLSKSVAIGLGFGWKFGILSSGTFTQNGQSITIDDLEKDSRNSIGHLDFSLGLRFR